MEQLLAIGIVAAMGGTLLALYTRLRSAKLDRDLGSSRKG